MYDGIVECQASAITSSVTFKDDLLKMNVKVVAQQQALSLLPKKLCKEWKKLRDIKAVGWRENYASLIDEKYHKEMYPMSLLDVWIHLKS